MILLPAIDLYNKCAVRLTRGDYNKMTVYSSDPVSFALEFKNCGTNDLHIVDLEGAKFNSTPNFEVVKSIVEQTGLDIEIGGGIRSFEVIDKYVSIGVKRVILGTAALNDRVFLCEALKKYGDHIAVGVDMKNGKVAVNGWLEVSDTDGYDFCKILDDIGVKTIICTDISKDGMLSGTNVPLYQKLSNDFKMNVIASGGVTDINDIKALMETNVYGAILGKALYTNNIDLKEAVRTVNGK